MPFACGASMGGSMDPHLLRAAAPTRANASPRGLTSAYLQLRMYEPDFEAVNTPFDEIIGAVERGEVDMGLLIHEGRHYQDHGLHLVAGRLTSVVRGLCAQLALGGNVVRQYPGRRLTARFNHVRASNA